MHISDMINALAVEYLLQGSGSAEYLFEGNNFIQSPLTAQSLFLLSPCYESGGSTPHCEAHAKGSNHSAEAECTPPIAEGSHDGGIFSFVSSSSKLALPMFNVDLQVLGGQHWARIAAIVYGASLSDSLSSRSRERTSIDFYEGRDGALFIPSLGTTTSSSSFATSHGGIFLSPSQIEQHCCKTLKTTFKGDFQRYQTYYRNLLFRTAVRSIGNHIGRDTLSSKVRNTETVPSPLLTILPSPFFEVTGSDRQEVFSDTHRIPNGYGSNRFRQSTEEQGSRRVERNPKEERDNGEKDPTSPCGKCCVSGDRDGRRSWRQHLAQFHQPTILTSASSPSSPSSFSGISGCGEPSCLTQGKIHLEEQFRLEKERDRAPYFIPWCGAALLSGSPAGGNEWNKNSFVGASVFSHTTSGFRSAGNVVGGVFENSNSSSSGCRGAVKGNDGALKECKTCHSGPPVGVSELLSLPSFSMGLSTEQRSFLSRLRHTPLSPELLTSFIQEFYLVEGSQVFFHDVAPDMMVEYNNMQAGPYRKVIAVPLSLLTMKRCVSDTRYQYDHSPHLFSHLSSCYKDDLSLTEYKHDGQVFDTFSAGPTPSLASSSVERKRPCTFSSAQRTTFTDSLPDRDLKVYDYQLLTLFDLERMIWHIAANCVFFNAPETLFRPTATKFALACSHIIQQYCLKQLYSPSPS